MSSFYYLKFESINPSSNLFDICIIYIEILKFQSVFWKYLTEKKVTETFQKRDLKFDEIFMFLCPNNGKKCENCKFWLRLPSLRSPNARTQVLAFFLAYSQVL